MIWWRLIQWMWSRGTVSGALLGTLFGTVIAPVYGTILGLFYGVILGASAGIVSGLALAILTHFRFTLPQDMLAYRCSAVAVALLCTIVIDLPLLNGMLWGIRVSIIFPMFIAAITASYFAWRFPDYAVKAFSQQDYIEKLFRHDNQYNR